MSRDHSQLRLALVGVVLLSVGGAALTGGVAAQTDSPTVRVTSATVEPGERATVDVVLTAAPDGLAGYAVDLVVEGDGVAITGASYPDAFGLSSTPAVADDGSRVTLEAADIGERIEPGATDVVLATVELRGDTAGEATLVLEPRQFDADGGASMSPAADAGTVTVGDGDTAGSAAAAGTSDVEVDDSTDAASTDSDAAETTSTSFALPAGGIALTALALVLVAVFAARRRR
jgi:hypothetical protein